MTIIISNFFFIFAGAISVPNYGYSDHLLYFKLQGKLIVFQCQNEYNDMLYIRVCVFMSVHKCTRFQGG